MVPSMVDQRREETVSRSSGAEDIEGDDLQWACGVVVQSCCQGIIARKQ